MENWIPRTDLGRKVKARSVTDINTVLDSGATILEPEITETLMPGVEHDLLLVGQSKGKFGGGKRRVFRQTQKKTREGNKPRFAAYAVIGNGDGIVGLGYGKARETVPAREKAVRAAKLNVFKVARGSGSWEGQVDEPHTVPFTVEGKCGSVVVRLIPAPKGKGLIAEKEIQKILKAAGIRDVWSKTFGQTKNKINLIKATENALRQLTKTKLRPQDVSNLHVTYGNTEPIAILDQAAAPSEQPAAPSAPAPEAKPEAAPKPAEEPATEPVSSESSAESSTQSVEGTPLNEIPGVGPARVKKLNEAGVMSAEQLAGMSVQEVSDSSGMNAGAAEKIIAAAKDLTGGAQ